MTLRKRAKLELCISSDLIDFSLCDVLEMGPDKLDRKLVAATGHGRRGHFIVTQKTSEKSFVDLFCSFQNHSLEKESQNLHEAIPQHQIENVNITQYSPSRQDSPLSLQRERERERERER